MPPFFDYTRFLHVTCALCFHFSDFQFYNTIISSPSDPLFHFFFGRTKLKNAICGTSSNNLVQNLFYWTQVASLVLKPLYAFFKNPIRVDVQLGGPTRNVT